MGGKPEFGHSLHTYVAANYLPLSAIAKLQLPSSFINIVQITKREAHYRPVDSCKASLTKVTNSM